MNFGGALYLVIACALTLLGVRGCLDAFHSGYIRGCLSMLETKIRNFPGTSLRTPHGKSRMCRG